MNNNNISTIVDQQTMTSLEIADILGRKHKNVLQAIRNMEPAWVNVTGLKFQLCKTSYEFGHNTKREIPVYILNRKECLFVATKFNDEARAKLVLRWEQLEKEKLMQQSQQPVPQSETPSAEPSGNFPVDPRNMSRLQILQLALQAEQENERLRTERDELEIEKSHLESDNYGLMLENSQKSEKIQQLEQRTAYLNLIMADNTSVTITQIAQDYGKSAKAFNNLLRGLQIQRKVGDQWILYADYINKGYVTTRMIPIHHAGRPDTYNPLTVWTQVGRKFLYERLRKEGILPLVERLQQKGGASC
jgi:phage regulator Rha-like protein/phage antirepressor YoqD-like protein